MTTTRLLAQIQAQIPECPLHMASAYLVEFTEMLKTHGRQCLVNLTDTSNQGFSTRLPDFVLSVQKIYANGLKMGTSLSEDQAAYLLYTYPDYVITNEDGDIITDEDGFQLGVG